VGQLAGGIAHDFNNLLTAINGYSELLLGMLPESSEPREFVKLIRQSGERASVLTRQLLAFGRRQVLAPRLVDINRSAEDLRILLERPFGSAIRIELQPQPGLWLTKVDPAQIEQVIMNLMLNARDAMPSGGVIRVRTANMTLDGTFSDISGEPARGEFVMIAVADEGVGIEPEVLPRIFEPFFTTKDKSKGSGLGLATAYGIVKQSRGLLQVQSLPGKGSEFRVFLPRATEAASSAADPQPVLPDVDAQAPLPGGSETILVAEDEDPVRNLVVGILKASHYRVLEAADGDAALRIAQGFPETIHLLLTDMTMPGLSGRDLARRLSGERPGMKILFMSGFSEEMVVASQDPEGRADFLPKPFSARELCQSVRAILDRPVGSLRPA
jgi:CheY-like chemotaxis protein